MRSPVRASVLPNCGGRSVMSVPTAIPPILRASMQRSLSRRTCGVASVRCQVRLRFTDCAMTE